NPSGDVKDQIKEPVLFLKAPSDYITEGNPIVIPPGYILMEELELGVIIGKTCKNVNVKDALDCIGGYCIALDMTAVKKGHIAKTPWTTSKTFDTSCPVSSFIPKEVIKDPDNVELFCTVNGQPQQDGNTNKLVFSATELISFISRYHTLEPNDMILTGTPPSPGTVKEGDIIEGGIKGGVTIKFFVKSNL
ncbi:hypothetical protein RI129_000008, partial [Pyrocoelia pectoralis]